MRLSSLSAERPLAEICKSFMPLSVIPEPMLNTVKSDSFCPSPEEEEGGEAVIGDLVVAEVKGGDLRQGPFGHRPAKAFSLRRRWSC